MHLPLDLMALCDEALDALLDTRQLGTEAGQGVVGEALGAVGLAMTILADAERIGGRLVRLARGVDLPVEREAALGKILGRSLERRDLVADFAGAGVEGGELGRGAVAATGPGSDVGGELAEARRAHAGGSLEAAELEPGIVGLAAQFGELRLAGGIEACRLRFVGRFGDQPPGLGDRGDGFGAAGLEAGAGLFERGLARRQVADGALRLVELGLRGGDVALRRAPGLALASLVIARGGECFGKGGGVGSAAVAAIAGLGDLRLELGETVALRQLLGGGGGSIRRGETVPAPERALFADQPLARLQLAHQAGAIGSIDDANLGEAPGEQRAARDELGQRRRASGQGGVVAGGGAGPVERRTGVRRGIEIVTERGAEGGFVAR